MTTSDGLWRGRVVLVTGSTGFVGSWLTRRLVRAGARVVGLWRDQVPDSPLRLWDEAEQVTWVRGDVQRFTELVRPINDYGVESVFHLAAQALVGVGNREPLGTLETNVRGTWNLLEACRRSPTVRSVVVASSDKAYGTQSTLPYLETAPLQGRHPYDVSKACADLVSQAYHASYGLPVVTIRWGNTYGGGDLNFSRLIPDVIRHLLAGRRPVIRSDGTCLRDYLYVEDAVEAYLCAGAAAGQPGVAGEAFNIGTGSCSTVLAVTRRIAQLLDRQDLEPMVQGRVENEIQEQVLAIDKARRLLGWRPQVELEQGLQQTIPWYQAFLTSPLGRLRYALADDAPD